MSLIHPFFQRIFANRDLANEYLGNGDRRFPSFTEFYRHLFQGNEGENFQSYLVAISTSFGFRKYAIFIDSRIRRPVAALFRALDMDPDTPENLRVLKFWLYLHKMYWLLHDYKYTREENLFSFFHDFPLKDVKVVILANDPSPLCKSSGKAFHLSQCRSTTSILEFLNKEMQILDSLDLGHDSEVPLALTQEEVYDSCDLQGWINEKVLLLNCRLTRKTRLWNAFIESLLQYLNKTCPNLVFILAGKVAAQKGFKKGLIDKRRHLIINVDHPSYYTYKKAQRGGPLDWEIALPFLNTNFYLFQISKSSPLIDWSNTSGNKQEDSDQRIAKLANFYKFILDKCAPQVQPNYRTNICDDDGNQKCIVETLPNGKFILRLK